MRWSITRNWLQECKYGGAVLRAGRGCRAP